MRFVNINDPFVLVAATLGVLVAVAALLYVGRGMSERRIRRWCQAECLTLLDWRGARFFEGPKKFWRSENQDAYWIEVRDHQGFTREGYLVFGHYWHPFSRKATVTWD